MTTTNLTKTNEDFEWFVENYPKFQKEYGNSFIVVKNKQVIGVYDNAYVAFTETKKEYAAGTFIVQECATTHEAYIAEIASFNFM